MVFFPFRNDSSPVAQGHPGPKICSRRELFRWAMDDSSSMMYIYICITGDGGSIYPKIVDRSFVLVVDIKKKVWT